MAGGHAGKSAEQRRGRPGKLRLIFRIDGSLIMCVVLAVSSLQRLPTLAPHQEIGAELSNAGHAQKAHRAVDLSAEDVENASHAFLPCDGQAEEMGSRDQTERSARGQRLDQVGAAPDAAIDLHWDTAIDRRDHAGERVEEAGAPSSCRPP